LRDPTTHFVDVARRFCAWAEAQPGSEEEEGKTAMHFLADLVSAIMATADLGYADDAEEDRVSDDEWKAVFKRFGFLPFNYYTTFFSPAKLYDEEPVVGDLADDLADIYRDLKAGLWLYDHGATREAVWTWRYYFRIHWGRHATNALYALHAWAADESIEL
jgi:hypothetical protein